MRENVTEKCCTAGAADSATKISPYLEHMIDLGSFSRAKRDPGTAAASALKIVLASIVEFGRAKLNAADNEKGQECVW
jgi:hypothetical protein